MTVTKKRKKFKRILGFICGTLLIVAHFISENGRIGGGSDVVSAVIAGSVAARDGILGYGIAYIVISTILWFFPINKVRSAAKKNNIKKLNELIRSGYSVDHVEPDDEDQDTPLIAAVKSNHNDPVDFLLERGADTNIIGNKKSSALFAAVYRNNLDIARKLINHGIDIDLQNDQGTTALIQASYNNNLELIKLLVENHANLNIKEKSGMTAISKAAIFGNKEAVSYLLEMGADPNIADNSGKTALDNARNSEISSLISQKRIDF